MSSTKLVAAVGTRHDADGKEVAEKILKVRKAYQEENGRVQPDLSRELLRQVRGANVTDAFLRAVRRRLRKAGIDMVPLSGEFSDAKVWRLCKFKQSEEHPLKLAHFQALKANKSAKPKKVPTSGNVVPFKGSRKR